MNRPIATSLLAVATALGFAAGYFRSRQGAPADPRASATPAPAQQTAIDTTATLADTPAQQRALSSALEAMLDRTGFLRHGNFSAAVQQLDLAHVRELHARVVQWPDDGRLLEMVADRWVELDPSYAAEYVRGLGDGDAMKDTWGLLAAWARRMPEAAIAEGLKAPGSSKSAELLKQAFTGLAERDPRAAVEQLGLIRDAKLREQIWGASLSAWVRNDPESATAWLRAHPESYAVGTSGNIQVANLAWRIAARDPALAIDFASTLTEPLRTQALGRACLEWASKDPVAALDWCIANDIPADHHETSSSSSVLTWSMRRSPAVALSWLERQPAELRARLAADALRTANAEVAMKVFALIPEADQPEQVWRLNNTLNNHQSGSARAWTLTLPEGPLRTASMHDIFTRYHFDDPVAVISKFPSGPSRDAAYAAHVEKTARRSQVPDIERLVEIADTQTRAQAATAVYENWRERDAKAAEQWLATTPHLSTEIKTRLQQRER